MNKKTYHHAKFKVVPLLSALALVFASCGEPKIEPVPKPEPEKTLESIAVTTPPAKMTYFVNETFAPGGWS